MSELLSLSSMVESLTLNDQGDEIMKVCILEHDNFRSFTEKRFQVVQVTKSGLVLHVYDTLCETLDRCKTKISEHGDELDKIGNIYQISK